MSPIACPACGKGFMCEHDIGYLECSECDFSAIFDDGREPPVWTREEIEAEMARELEIDRESRRQLAIGADFEKWLDPTPEEEEP